MKNDKPKLLRSCPPQGLVQIPKKKKVASTAALLNRETCLWRGGGGG